MTRSGRVAALLALMTGGVGVCPAGVEPVGQPRTLYVNNVTGSDDSDGLKPDPAGGGAGGPFASIGKAFASVQTSDRVEIANTGKPYRGGNTLVKAGGTADRPMVINGNGATLSGLDRGHAARGPAVGYVNRPCLAAEAM